MQSGATGRHRPRRAADLAVAQNRLFGTEIDRHHLRWFVGPLCSGLLIRFAHTFLMGLSVPPRNRHSRFAHRLDSELGKARSVPSNLRHRFQRIVFSPRSGGDAPLQSHRYRTHTRHARELPGPNSTLADVRLHTETRQDSPCPRSQVRRSPDTYRIATGSGTARTSSDEFVFGFALPAEISPSLRAHYPAECRRFPAARLRRYSCAHRDRSRTTSSRPRRSTRCPIPRALAPWTNHVPQGCDIRPPPWASACPELPRPPAIAAPPADSASSRCAD